MSTLRTPRILLGTLSCSPCVPLVVKGLGKGVSRTVPELQGTFC